MYADAEKELKMQNIVSEYDLSHKAYMQTIKFKSGTTAEYRYRKMLRDKQQEQEQNLIQIILIFL